MEFLDGMNALTLVFAAICLFAISYRIYGVFLTNKVLRLNNKNITPAVKYADGRDYIATNAISGFHAIIATGTTPKMIEFFQTSCLVLDTDKIMINNNIRKHFNDYFRENMPDV